MSHLYSSSDVIQWLHCIMDHVVLKEKKNVSHITHNAKSSSSSGATKGFILLWPVCAAVLPETCEHSLMDKI